MRAFVGPVSAGVVAVLALALITFGTVMLLGALPAESVSGTTAAAAGPRGPVPPADGRSSATPPPANSTTQRSRDDLARAAVERFYVAVNAGDYRTAWRLGGRNLSDDFTDFAAGYATTRTVRVAVTGVDRGVVAVRLTATHTDGTVVRFVGTYTTEGEQIVDGDVGLVE